VPVQDGRRPLSNGLPGPVADLLGTIRKPDVAEDVVHILCDWVDSAEALARSQRAGGFDGEVRKVMALRSCFARLVSVLRILEPSLRSPDAALVPTVLLLCPRAAGDRDMHRALAALIAVAGQLSDVHSRSTLRELSTDDEQVHGEAIVSIVLAEAPAVLRDGGASVDGVVGVSIRRSLGTIVSDLMCDKPTLVAHLSTLSADFLIPGLVDPITRRVNPLLVGRIESPGSPAAPVEPVDDPETFPPEVEGAATRICVFMLT
jgi:hypothetical protein